MAVPKYRTSSSARDRRRSHLALEARGVSTCSNCGEVRLPHTVCGACGFYNGKQVMEPKSAKQAEQGDNE
jgi:large subunit ribosomal protein L32